MKKIFYIAGFGLLIGAASCSKEDIKPINQSPNVPSWEAEKAALSGDSDDGKGEDVDFNEGITDPNWDEDGNGKKKN